MISKAALTHSASRLGLVVYVEKYNGEVRTGLFEQVPTRCDPVSKSILLHRPRRRPYDSITASEVEELDRQPLPSFVRMQTWHLELRQRSARHLGPVCGHQQTENPIRQGTRHGRKTWVGWALVPGRNWARPRRFFIDTSNFGHLNEFGIAKTLPTKILQRASVCFNHPEPADVPP